MKVSRLGLGTLGVLVLAASNPLLADSMRVNLLPDDLGPFQPNAGGYIALNVALELYDSEGDGQDTQGVAAALFNLFTNTEMTIPSMTYASTGEPSTLDPASVYDVRFEPTEAVLLEPLFIGGYGFNGFDGPFGGTPQDDDLIGIGQTFPMVWEADVEPNVPGSQPWCLPGIGYGERPPGGDWLFATGKIPIPTDAGVYTVSLDPYYADYILPDVDLRTDHVGGWRGLFDADQRIGDSFTFTVLPEPGSFVLGLIGAMLTARRRRAV